MIAAMPDFERIDRELAALGSVPEGVQRLLDEHGQRDRSLENIDQVLAALRDGRPPSSSPPEQVIERPSFLPLGWDADRKSEPGEPVPAIASERQEIPVHTGAPQAMVDETPVAPAQALQAAASSVLSDDASIAPPDRDSAPIDTQQSSPPPPAEDPPPMPSASFAPADGELSEPQPMRRSSRPPRPDLQALLDAELDPKEFPSTNPPPLRIVRSPVPSAQSLPPPLPRASQAPAAPVAQEADFELLVDDDDILEIDEEES